jgi:putative chitinase
MGNGPETSGEGFKYRGRGCIQLTGKDNYRAAGLALKVDLLTNPDLACEMPYALETAAWFWNSRGLNALADAQDQVGICKRVNGGVIGLEERKTLYQRVLAVVS